jgi:hypothetical protein
VRDGTVLSGGLVSLAVGKWVNLYCDYIWRRILQDPFWRTLCRDRRQEGRVVSSSSTKKRRVRTFLCLPPLDW